MRTLFADDEVPRPEQQRGTPAELTAALIASLGIEVTPWQETLLDWALWRASGPIVATAGPAFPTGAAVPGVIVAEYIDGR